MALFCIEEAGRRQHLRVGGRLDYQQLIGTSRGAKALAEWMIRSGEIRPVLASQAPSLQLVGSGEATSLGTTGCKCRMGERTECNEWIECLIQCSGHVYICFSYMKSLDKILR
jgi:hypothetical protein